MTEKTKTTECAPYKSSEQTVKAPSPIVIKFNESSKNLFWALLKGFFRKQTIWFVTTDDVVEILTLEEAKKRMNYHTRNQSKGGCYQCNPFGLNEPTGTPFK